MDNEKLALLIEKCIGNNKHAQLQLYDLFAKTMYNTSLRILKDTMAAEDMVQEAFISAFRSLKNFRYEIPFHVWLKKIVVNKSLDYIRRQKNAPLYQDEMDGAEGQYMETDLTDLTVHETLITKIKEGIKSLPDGYRIIFSLYFFEGFDHDEIGKILNIAPSTSRSQLTRAKQQLIRILNLKKKLT